MPCSQLRLLSKYSVNVFDALHICRLGLAAKIASIQSRKNRTANEVLRRCEIYTENSPAPLPVASLSMISGQGKTRRGGPLWEVNDEDSRPSTCGYGSGGAR
jgi:hypothetical protein